jgi:hypothetical protein
MVLIVWDVDIDGSLRADFIADVSRFDIQDFLIGLIIDGIDTSITAIMSMSMSQLVTSMALSPGDDDNLTPHPLSSFTHVQH